MECKLGYGFGRSACIQWLQVVEILLVCTYSSTHSFLFKRLIVSTMHLFTNLSIKLLHSFPHPPSHKPQPCLLCSSILPGFHSLFTPLSTSFPPAHSTYPSVQWPICQQPPTFPTDFRGQTFLLQIYLLGAVWVLPTCHHHCHYISF